MNWSNVALTFRAQHDVLCEEKERSKTHLLQEFISMIQANTQSEVSLQRTMLCSLSHKRQSHRLPFHHLSHIPAKSLWD